MEEEHDYLAPADSPDKCEPSIGYHVVLMGSDECQCGERKRMNSAPTEEDSPKNILGCARCGGEHLVRFKEFRIPITVGDAVLTHWGTCPTTREPILMRFAEAAKAEEN